MAGKQRAEQWAELCRQREEEDRQQRVTVITEFDAGNPEATLHALADEILKYRRVLRLLARAIGWRARVRRLGCSLPACSGVRGAPSMVPRVRRLRRRLRARRSIRLSLISRYV